MVPRKFNIVEFGGFDLAGQYGEALPGIYDKIVDAHWNCVYIMCFGLKFAGFDIAPQYMTPEMFSDHIMLNGIISIDQNDVITIPSIEPPAPPPVEPVIIALNVVENGTTYAPPGVDGFNPVTVEVEGSDVVKLMDKGQVSTLSSYATAYFDSGVVLSDYDFLIVELFKNSSSLGAYGVNGNVSLPMTFVIAGDSGGPYHFRLTANSIACYAYSGAWSNLYVDVYGANK